MSSKYTLITIKVHRRKHTLNIGKKLKDKFIRSYKKQMLYKDYSDYFWSIVDVKTIDFNGNVSFQARRELLKVLGE